MAEGSETPRATSTDKLDIITKALRLLPDFDGNPNVLTRFVKLCDQLVAECVSRENQFNNLILINGILNKISGPAARLINSNGIPETGAGIRNALVNNFADQRDETSLYNDLALLTQGSSTPQEFYEKCQNLFSTIMTYISLHETVDTTIESKRDLYKKLTLQAFIRGLKDPLGYRIRCMRPETIEKALEFVHEEMNTLCNNVIIICLIRETLSNKTSNINSSMGQLWNLSRIPQLSHLLSQSQDLPDLNLPNPNSYRNLSRPKLHGNRILTKLKGPKDPLVLNRCLPPALKIITPNLTYLSSLIGTNHSP